MDKKKFEVIILIILLAFGLNYVIYSYYIQPQSEEIKAAEENYNRLKSEVQDSRFKKADLEDLKKSIEENSQKPDNAWRPPETTDNQTIIREFYAACKAYGVKGDSLSFSLQGSVQPAEKNDNAEGNASSEPAAEEESSLFKNLKPQYILLTFSGEKGKVENFIENIRTVSSRKLIVGGIEITSEAGVSINNTSSTAAQVVKAQVTLIEFLYSPITASSSENGGN